MIDLWYLTTLRRKGSKRGWTGLGQGKTIFIKYIDPVVDFSSWFLFMSSSFWTGRLIQRGSRRGVSKYHKESILQGETIKIQVSVVD